ncbi:2-keto-4-pentenoate hydratase [Protofrankia coriariae]|uniref:2-keto-4-pentenoate hydratase n=1 Tax=Protofrankia coriariae TaxID=1562887 RepID=A0ABR5F3J5_9ACTN|nr:fumarylacetoacetate hydrolase family protein [Protofrankia coriariae]KLL11262.1 2-keto-4-pentenoate hydratase [Protofrankia coriariae]
MTSSPTSAGTVPDLERYRQAADRLTAATRQRTPCPPVRDLLGESDIAAAYAVQQLLTRAAVGSHRSLVGHKIGLTSPAVQRQLGVDQPDSGVLFADMARAEGSPIDPADLLQPRIEAEVAFVLGADLDQPNLDLETARASVAQVLPALEIVDSRIANWDISIVDTVADNASCGLFVLGAHRQPLGDLDLTTLTMAMTADERVVSEGVGAACLGDPCQALLWLARTAREFGSPLRAGDLVLSGALGPMVPVTPGTTYRATITGLGTVTASFRKDLS